MSRRAGHSSGSHMYIIFCIPYVKWGKFYPYFSNEETATEADLSKLSKVLRQLVAECGADPGQTELCVRPPNHHTPPMLTHRLPLYSLLFCGDRERTLWEINWREEAVLLSEAVNAVIVSVWWRLTPFPQSPARWLRGQPKASNPQGCPLPS